MGTGLLFEVIVLDCELVDFLRFLLSIFIHLDISDLSASNIKVCYNELLVCYVHHISLLLKVLSLGPFEGLLPRSY